MSDVAFFLTPSLTSEGGPQPEEVLPTCPPELVAFVSGFFASRAGQPQLPHEPPFAARFRLATPDGTSLGGGPSLGLPEPTTSRRRSRRRADGAPVLPDLIRSCHDSHQDQCDHGP